MKNLLLLLLCCSAGLVLAGEPVSLRFQRAVLDAQPPQNPWIKIVGDLNGDSRPDLLGANHGGPFQPVELWLNRTTTSSGDDRLRSGATGH